MPGLILKNDYGALEYRVLGMASHDKVIIDSLANGYDVHMVWAKKINEKWPKTYEKKFGDFDDVEKLGEWRSYVKSYMVFAAFYGSMPEPIAKALEVPMNIFKKLYDEFWEYFYGVKKWQEEQVKFYQKYGYVQTLTGFRRYAPLSDNMIFNTPIQGTGSDIVVESMNALNEIALETGDLVISPNLNVHDDLTTEIPDEKDLEYYKRIYVKEMVKKRFDFINVPLLVEVAAGPNWFDTKKIGKYQTDALPKEWY